MADDIPFSGGEFDRAAHFRRDAEFLSNALSSPQTKVMALRDGAPLIIGAQSSAHVAPGEPVVEGDRSVAWLGPDEISPVESDHLVFLGVDSDGAACFAANITGEPEIASVHGAAHEDARACASFLPVGDSRLVATARSIFAWHKRHRFCSNCGAATYVEEAGWKRKCAACNGDHFPRVDPVAIMLAVRGDKCLLGRHASWKPNYYSCLAGFIEPGETPEQAAARELLEETGVRATGVCDYLFCQPRPWPSNLMVGMIIEAASDEIKVDENEIEQANWYSREEAAVMLRGEHEITVPQQVAIAHHIIRKWVG